MTIPFSYLTQPPAPTYPEYAELRAIADRTPRGFVVRAEIDDLQRRSRKMGPDWLTSVLGRPEYDVWRLTGPDTELVKLALARGINPPLPAWIVESREESRRREQELAHKRQALRDRDIAAWQATREQATVALEVHPNTTARVRDGGRHYLGHAVPLSDVFSGARRIRRHPAGRALCETENRSRPLLLGEKTDDPATCDRCLAWAVKVRQTREPLIADDRGGIGEVLTPVVDAAWEEHVRPVGWCGSYATLDVVDMGDGWVKVLWRCDPDDTPLAAFTMFKASEKVWVKVG